jgi:branched-chain amino acid transport system permease protein
VDYLLHVLVMVCLYVVLATSFNLLIGFAGLFALSHAAFYAIGAYVTAILATSLHLPFPIPLLAAVLFAAAVGILVALPALRVAGEYLVVVTLALQVIVLQVILNWKGLTGGTDGISGVPGLAFFGWRLDGPAKFLPFAAAMAVLCFAAGWRLAHSPFGRALRAMRENESATQAVGKNLLTMKVTVFAFSAALAAVAGSLFAHYFTYVGADSFTIEETIYILAMVIVGGTGNLWGSALGAVILVVLPELLKFIALPADIADKSRLIIYGLALILILRFRPQGLIPEARAAAQPGSQAPVAQPASLVLAEELRGQGGGGAGGPVLLGKGLQKSFGGIRAVEGLDIELKGGVITGLIGPNGFLKPDAGEVTLRGGPITRLEPHRIVAAGVARSFQDLRLFTKMTVLDNVLVALPGQTGDRVLPVFFRPAKVRREEAENLARAMAILRFVELDGKAREIAESLSYAEEKLLVVARLLATGAEVLLFDEPLSGLDQATLQELFPVVRRLAESGKAICIIEHNLDVIKGLCDVVYFLDEGRAIAVGTPDEVMTNPELATRYFK